MSFVIPFPQIDPVLIAFGPLVIRWYALAYIAGLLGGWALIRRFGARSPLRIDPVAVDDFMVWATLGVILGGRIGFVLFYNLPFYLQNPLQILQVWQGGMSFHGGLLGVTIAMFLFTRKRGLSFLAFTDVVACVTPIGLFFGRIANFINGELWGRVTDVPWAMVFPRGGSMPRHPSQLYEAALEGIVLFIIVNLVARSHPWRHRPGLVTGVFLFGYGLARGSVEFVRQYDIQVGLLWDVITMGQLLSIPMMMLGLYLIWRSKPVAEKPVDHKPEGTAA
ncbi:prolipoprotein diacylglyceryl transferase [Magnetospira sp. QH-2]|uniref:prolipoprotein diacylglyceryl transferase n=1 Tax=Magnetospira sp. (strain QH-2) TaxID=1288970 RepID=UPI0003E81290|nr:prolipoprotein diacylglyceryl transferase [Magnetospira sp. QH-2]CCQ72280.1 Prolipoprotein diacylglyceryl transferase [Magnetospira sp. QH-2]